ncbi:hypothetical protein KA405_05825 [Patescibacteria group bacterium]|nr:hypothetical protein [Patescibacteria group bacterium]
MIVFIFIHIVASIINSKAIPYRKERIKTQHIYNAQLVKIIMSKFEILQNDKSGFEISKIDTLADHCTHLNRKEKDYLFFINNIPLFLIQTVKITIYCVV